MPRLTKQQVKDKLQSLSSDQQVEQPSEESLDEAFLNLVYDAQSVKYTEDEVGIESTTFDAGDGGNFDDAFRYGVKDGEIEHARWVLKHLFGIDLKLLQELLS